MSVFHTLVKIRPKCFAISPVAFIQAGYSIPGFAQRQDTMHSSHQKQKSNSLFTLVTLCLKMTEERKKLKLNEGKRQNTNLEGKIPGSK